MKLQYVPILKAKKGEFDALKHASSSDKRRVIPLFEVPRFSKTVEAAKRFEGSTTKKRDYLLEIVEGIQGAWTQPDVMVDTFAWEPDDSVETGESVVEFLHRELCGRGFSPIPVLGYDRLSSSEYLEAIRSLEPRPDGRFCLRLDSNAIDDSLDPEYLQSEIVDALLVIGVQPEKCVALIDAGDVSGTSLDLLIEGLERVMTAMASFKFEVTVIASCSLPPSIDKAVPKRDSVGKVLRKEMLAWQTLSKVGSDRCIVYGDYGVRGPNSAVDIVTPDANGKIRYTIDRQYLIARGHSNRQGNRGQQMFDPRNGSCAAIC